jgi:hypothetical protein
MRDDVDRTEQKRRKLAAIGKEQLIELLVELWVSAESLVDGAAEAPRRSAKDKSKFSVRLTKTWTAILRRLSTFKHFRAADVILVSREFQNDGKISRIQTPGSARAQLCHLTRKGVIKRLGGGNYRVTEQTKNALEHSRR